MKNDEVKIIFSGEEKDHWKNRVACNIPLDILNDLAEAIEIKDNLREHKIRTGFSNELEELFANEKLDSKARSILIYCGLQELV